MCCLAFTGAAAAMPAPTANAETIIEARVVGKKIIDRTSETIKAGLTDSWTIIPSTADIGWGSFVSYYNSINPIKEYNFSVDEKYDEEKQVYYWDCGGGLSFYKQGPHTPQGLISVMGERSYYRNSNGSRGSTTNYIMYVEPYYGLRAIVFDPNVDKDFDSGIMHHLEGVNRLPECTYNVPVGKKFAGWEIDGKTYQVGDTVNLTETITIAKAIWEDSGESPRGDMDGSGTITADDAQMALMAYLKLLSTGSSGLTGVQFETADVDKNGILNADDAQYILIYATQFLAGLNPQWSDIIQ